LVFGLLTPVERLAETTLDWLASEQDRTRLKQPARVALAWQNTDHGREYRAGVSGWLARHPGRFELVLDEPFEHLAKDHTALIVKVKTSAADVFLSDAHEPDYVLQHRAYVEQRLRHAVVSYGARGPEKSAREALGEHVDYIVAAQWWSPELRYPESRRFSEAFEKAYGEEPNEFYPALAYEGARTLIDAIQRADSLDADAIQKALAASDRRDSLLPGKHVAFPVASRFQIDNPCVLVQNQPGGEVAIIYPLDAATAEAVIPPAP
jgi:branched-chain amino acid transport system substrate-binding protein